MVTIVTHVELKPGTQGDWTRASLDALEARPAQEWWHEVVEERGLAA